MALRKREIKKFRSQTEWKLFVMKKLAARTPSNGSNGNNSSQIYWIFISSKEITRRRRVRCLPIIAFSKDLATIIPFRMNPLSNMTLMWDPETKDKVLNLRGDTMQPLAKYTSKITSRRREPSLPHPSILQLQLQRNQSSVEKNLHPLQPRVQEFATSGSEAKSAHSRAADSYIFLVEPLRRISSKPMYFSSFALATSAGSLEGSHFSEVSASASLRPLR